MRGEYAQSTREGLDQVSADREDIYLCRPPARLMVPILVQMSAVNDDIQEKADIEMRVQVFKCGRAGGLFGMHVK